MSKNTNLSFLTDYITADITNGRIGINNASPTVAFDVVGATKITGNVGISGSPSNGLIPGLVIGDGTDNKGITLFGTTTTQQNIAFTDTANSQQGLIQYDHSGDYMRFFTATSERMRITSTGNVGIGTSSPSAKLQVDGYGTANSIMTYVCAKFYGGGSGGLNIGTDGTNPQIATDSSGVDLTFLTRVSGVFYERMRITSGGQVGIGTSNPFGIASSLVAICGNGQTYNLLNIQETNNIANVAFVQFLNSAAAACGTITRVGTTNAVAYNSTSDYRLKEDLREIKGLEKVSAIKVYDFKWKDNEFRMDGVLAHELQEIIPFAVTGIKDGERMQAVDYSKIVPVLVKAIQELKAEIETLKNK